MDYVNAVRLFRNKREEIVGAADGPLTWVDLVMMEEGQTIELNMGAATLRNGRLEIRGRDKDEIWNSLGAEEEITIGTITTRLILRDGKYAVRIRDAESEARKNFSGLKWYDIDERYCVMGTLQPQPKKIQIDNPFGTTARSSPGLVSFTLMGNALMLEPILENDRLFFVFRDQTSGDSTYGAGRFLYTSLPSPETGLVTLDFNQAFNPPCAFTSFATCPRAPKQNVMPIRIEAGEMDYISKSKY